eukprot:jgi/Ulvmu1/8623/UM046_0023.1
MKPTPITFSVAAEPSPAAADDSAAAKLKARAAKFGNSVTDEDIAKIIKSRRPGLLRDALQKEASASRKDHISTGFDLYSQDQIDKQSQRSARFGTSAPATGVAIAQVPEGELARKKRAEKFGLEYEEPDQAGIDNRIVLEKRQDTDGIAEARLDALHLYGVDLLATHDILSHFSAYNPTFVEWINDSSCNVCFPDEFAVKRVIIQLGEALTAQETTDSGVMLLEDAAQPEVWHRSKTAITKSGVAVPLLFRVATSSDAKNPLRQHKRRGLWKLPVRQALQVVQSGADVEDEGAPQGGRPRGRGSVQGRGGKRSRLDADGDVVMEGEGGGRGGRRRRRTRDGADADPADGAADLGGGGVGGNGRGFLFDDEREVVQPQGGRGLRSAEDGAGVEDGGVEDGGVGNEGGVRIKEEEAAVKGFAVDAAAAEWASAGGAGVSVKLEEAEREVKREGDEAAAMDVD